MRRLLIALLALSPTSAFADRGGPDRYGYEWVDSLEAEVETEWVEVEESAREPVVFLGFPLGDGLELGMATVDLGFPFELYGEPHEEATLVSAGALLFQALAGVDWQCPLPSPGSPNGAIYGFLQFLDPWGDPAGEVYVSTLGEAPERRFVATFEGVTEWRGIGTPWEREADPVTFQIVLYEGSDEVQVNVLESGLREGGGLDVTSATVIGIESPDGAAGTGRCDGVGSIPDDYSIRFRRSDRAGVFPEAQGRSGPAGADLLFDLEVVGFGEDPVDATVTARSRLGWTLAVVPEEIEVGPRGRASTVTVAVSIPLDAEPAVADDVRVVVDAEGQEIEALLWPRPDPPASGWEEIAPLPMALRDPAVVALGGALYSLGGRLESDGWRPVSATFRYDPSQDRWSDGAVADLPTPLVPAGACSLGGRIYVVGGSGDVVEVEPGVFASAAAPGLLVYDHAEDRWTAGPDLPVPVSTGALACDAARGRLHLVGGFADGDGDGLYWCGGRPCRDGVLAISQSFDVARSLWELGPPPPYAIADAAAGFVSDQLVLAGGSTVFFGVRGDTALLDLSARRWSAGPALLVARSRAASIALGGRLCLLGGFAPGAPGGVTSRWDCFDGRSWAQSGAPLPVPLAGLGAASLGDDVYAVGGVGEGSHGSGRAWRWRRVRVEGGDGDGDGDADADGPDAWLGDADAEADGGHLGVGGGGCGCRVAGGSGAGVATFAVIALAGAARRAGGRRR